jgi:hypothetical protein
LNEFAGRRVWKFWLIEAASKPLMDRRTGHPE